jgi:ribosomal protein L37AE/L43A
MSIPMPLNHCDKCGSLTIKDEDDYGEFVCEDCEQNAAEAAWERHCEDFHDGGATSFRSLQQQQQDAWRLK